MMQFINVVSGEADYTCHYMVLQYRKHARAYYSVQGDHLLSFSIFGLLRKLRMVVVCVLAIIAATYIRRVSWEYGVINDWSTVSNCRDVYS
ncbi:hypothetical protein HOLleu_27606 [Holothuria leucospilota]|uniref:Uncharacterized protein n=1 Tax=Holothuria leucospilota TaxID=206669 RepID=A0A9Q1BQP4_HOLLE|nr:hypothetical protein HOLleu_27606 [Holothuria leucospilota]